MSMTAIKILYYEGTTPKIAKYVVSKRIEGQFALINTPAPTEYAKEKTWHWALHVKNDCYTVVSDYNNKFQASTDIYKLTALVNKTIKENPTYLESLIKDYERCNSSPKVSKTTKENKTTKYKYPNYKNAEGVQLLLSAVVRDAINTYVQYGVLIKKYENILKNNLNKDKEVLRQKKGTNEKVKVLITKEQQDARMRHEILSMDGERKYILKWLLSGDFKRLYGDNISGQYVYEQLLQTDKSSHKFSAKKVIV